MLQDPVHTSTTSIPDGGVVNFRLSPEHTTVTFTTRHLFGLGAVNGSVKMIGGRVALDGDRLVLLEAELDMASFSSASKKRDQVVASTKFLDSEANPVATYRGTKAERTSDGVVVRGVLTVKGIASPVDLRVTLFEVAPGATAQAKATVDRFDFGITVPTALASRNLQVSISTRLDPEFDLQQTVRKAGESK